MLLDVAEQDEHQTLGRQFHFVRRIGTGGFGDVYLAEMSTASGFAKMVAIKLLKGEVRGDENVAERMRDEARLLGMLQHRTIVQAEDLISISGRVAVVMEYVPGCNWSLVIHPERNTGTVPPRVVLGMVHHVSNALDVAFHRPSSVTGTPLEVLHRDIKPGNIRLTPDGEFKVLDFGIARGQGIDREAHTTEYQLGSLNYMAPELLAGEDASPASDIYALGVTLFESIERNRYGWAGEDATMHNTKLESRLAKLNLSTFGPLAAEVGALLSSTMAYKPSERPTPEVLASLTRELERRAPGEDTESYCKTVIVALAELDETVDPDAGEFTGRVVFEDDSSAMMVAVEGAMFLDDQTIAVPQPAAVPWRRKSNRRRFSDVVILLLLFAITAVMGWTQMMQSDPNHGLEDRKDMVPPSQHESNKSPDKREVP
jgi:serine/threonine protein kinase